MLFWTPELLVDSSCRCILAHLAVFEHPAPCEKRPSAAFPILVQALRTFSPGMTCWFGCKSSFFHHQTVEQETFPGTIISSTTFWVLTYSLCHAYMTNHCSKQVCLVYLSFGWHLRRAGACVCVCVCVCGVTECPVTNLSYVNRGCQGQSKAGTNEDLCSCL